MTDPRNGRSAHALRSKWGDTLDLDSLPRLSEGFKVIPSLAVMGNTPVWVGDGKYNPMTFNGKRVSPQAIARILSENFDMLHYIDITGIRKGKVEWNTFQSVMDEMDEVWADVGITFSDTIIDTLMSGASFGVITTKMIESIEEIASAYELTENIILQIDMDENGVVAKDPAICEMGLRGIIKEMSTFGMDTFIIEDMNEENDHPAQGKLTEAMSALPRGGRLFAGVDNIRSLRKLDEMGLDGAIISASRFIMRG